MDTSSKSFNNFLSYFPFVELPLTLMESDYHSYSIANDQLPEALLYDFITRHLPIEIDEFTEFMPCFQFSYKPNMHHLVLWMAQLMHYSYYLINFNRQGKFIDLKEIAGFYTRDNMIFHKMARIDEAGNIFVIEGGVSDRSKDFDPASTRKWEIDIGDDGSIIEYEL